MLTAVPQSSGCYKLAIGPCPVAFPGGKNRADSAPKLFLHVVRERFSEDSVHLVLVQLGDTAQVGHIEIGIEIDALRLLLAFQNFLEHGVLDFRTTFEYI